MCGIVGVLNKDRSPVNKSLLNKMTDILIHRGPDGKGTWINNHIGFGHRRLSIIDLSKSASQPMLVGEGKFSITYNGEIYNYLDIRLELESKGYKFKSNSDTEVVLKSYVEWGEKCLLKFNGMFAFGIWDDIKQELFIARDRYGIKPLYYYDDNDIIIFASEIKSILKHPKIKVKVSKSALNQYFTFQNVFTDETLFDKIKLLPAGFYALNNAKNKILNFNQYWDFNFEESSIIKSENE